MNGNPTATILPPAAEPVHPPADRALVTLLKLTAAADRLVAGVRSAPLPDSTRALVDELAAATTAAWEVLGPERRMTADG